MNEAAEEYVKLVLALEFADPELHYIGLSGEALLEENAVFGDEMAAIVHDRAQSDSLWRTVLTAPTGVILQPPRGSRAGPPTAAVEYSKGSV